MHEVMVCDGYVPGATTWSHIWGFDGQAVRSTRGWQ